MGLLDHLTCLLRNLYAGQEATVRIGHGTTDWFQIGKGVYESCILSSCLCNLYAECIRQNAWLDEAQAGVKITWRNINNFIYADKTTHDRKWRWTEESLVESEIWKWKSWLKTQHSKKEDHVIQTHHFIGERWRNNGDSDRLYFLGLQNHCRCWLQPWN